MNSVYLIAGLFLAGFSIYILTNYFFREGVIDSDTGKEERNTIVKKSILLRFFFFLSPYIWRLHPEEKLARSLSSISKRLDKAGNPFYLTPSEFFVLREVSAIIVFIAGLVIISNLFILIPVSLLGFFLPEIYLRDRRLRREREFVKGFSFALDLLAITVEAGLDFLNALKRVVEKSPSGVTRNELERILKEIMMGQTKRDALKKFAERWDIVEVKSFVRAVLQSEALGTSIANSLKGQADMLRQRRFQRAEKLAMEAPVKMLLPLLFIFASVFVFLFGPIIIKVIRGGFF